jgi:putative Holliday junction resolvase
MKRERDVLLAFDFGSKRIGIASGNLLTRTASPVTTLTVGRDVPWHSLDQLVADWAPNLLVVGLPGDQQRAINTMIEDFVAMLAARYGLPVATVDEALSSAAARSALNEGRASGRHARPVTRDRIDRHAACLIAEQWMGEHST